MKNEIVDIFDNWKEKYINNPVFHSLVNTMVQAIEDEKTMFNLSDVRDLLYACEQILHERKLEKIRMGEY